MSVESMGWALNVDDPELTPHDRLVLIGVANHDGDGGAWPSLATLARYTGTTTRTVRRSLAKLEERGWLTRRVNQGGTRETRDDRRPTRYEIHRCGQPVSRGDADVRPSTSRGDASVRHGGTPTSSEPSLNRPVNNSSDKLERERPGRQVRDYDMDTEDPEVTAARHGVNLDDDADGVIPERIRELIEQLERKASS